MLKRLPEKTQFRLNRESGTIFKPHGRRLKVALAFPNTYHVGMSNLGYQLVYRLFNESDDVVCERVFLPDAEDITDIEDSREHLRSMESWSKVDSFDILAFSSSYELDYPNILRIMSMSGIPLKAAERRDGRYPLVVGGGPAVTFNPEPLAPFFDAFIIGDAEAVVPDMIPILLDNDVSDRESLLQALCRLPGVYVPEFYIPEYKEDGTIARVSAVGDAPKQIHRQWVKNLDRHHGSSVILTPETEFSNMILAEVARGCGRHCRFCAAGYTYLPPRARTASRLMEEMEDLLNEDKSRRVGLMSASVFDHPASLLICEALAEQDRLYSISSTRADTLQKQVVDALRKGAHHTLTIAPEAGTDRLRNVINKRITHQQIIEAAQTAWDGGFRQLRLYFMVGLPSETDADIQGIIDLIHEIRGMFRWERIAVSVSCFVPKPGTPFQWAGMCGEKELERRLGVVKTAMRGLGNIDLSGESARSAVVQGVLSRGDRRVGDVLVHRIDSNVSWRAAFRNAGIDPTFYANRERERDEVFPWDHLDLGVAKEYLWREYERAFKEQPTTPCVVGSCRSCGVCVECRDRS